MEPDLCDRFFYIITLINLGHNCLFHKGFCMFLLSDNKHNVITLTHSAQIKHASLVKTKEMSKPQKQILKKKVFLELLHQKLGHRSTRSLLAGESEMFWQDIDLRIDSNQF